MMRNHVIGSTSPAIQHQTHALPERAVEEDAALLDQIHDALQISLQPDGNVDKRCILI